MKTVCVTGHRPAKLPWGYKKEGPDYDEYIELDVLLFEKS